jgi:hypothetical protein
MKQRILGLSLLMTMLACYYDVEEDFKQMTDCDTESVMYSSTIVDIVSARCYKCHAAALNLGNVTLEGYQKIKIYVDNGRLLGAIKRLPGFSPMPQNEAMLPGCDVNKIETWINNGAPNN